MSLARFLWTSLGILALLLSSCKTAETSAVQQAPKATSNARNSTAPVIEQELTRLSGHYVYITPQAEAGLLNANLEKLRLVFSDARVANRTPRLSLDLYTSGRTRGVVDRAIALNVTLPQEALAKFIGDYIDARIFYDSLQTELRNLSGADVTISSPRSEIDLVRPNAEKLKAAFGDRRVRGSTPVMIIIMTERDHTVADPYMELNPTKSLESIVSFIVANRTNLLDINALKQNLGRTLSGLSRHNVYLALGAKSELLSANFEKLKLIFSDPRVQATPAISYQIGTRGKNLDDGDFLYINAVDSQDSVIRFILDNAGQ